MGAHDGDASVEHSANAAVPILSVGDIEEAERFYGRLGFRVRTRHAGYLVLESSAVELHLSHRQDHDPKTTDGMIYLRVTNASAVYARLCDGLEADGLLVLNPPGPLTARTRAELARREAGGLPHNRVHAIHDTDWGTREFAVVDPAGNLVRIGERLRERG